MITQLVPIIIYQDLFLTAKHYLLLIKSRVEDHDDLVPIFNRQSEVLKETYGKCLTNNMHFHQLSCCC